MLISCHSTRSSEVGAAEGDVGGSAPGPTLRRSVPLPQAVASRTTSSRLNRSTMRSLHPDRRLSSLTQQRLSRFAFGLLSRRRRGSRAVVCTVVVRWAPQQPVQVLALRDELVGRDFDDPAAWWPDQPSVVGGRDRVAGGSWCVTDVDSGVTALVLNRPQRRLAAPGASSR